MAKIRRAEENDTVLKMTSLSSKPLEALSESEKIELTEQQQGLDGGKAEGTFVRLRRRWLEEGEQSSAYFFRLERQQTKNNIIQQLKMDRLISEDQKRIANYCAEFYSNLYTSKYCHQSSSDFFDSICNINQLSEADSIFCEHPIVLNEIIDTINHLMSL